MPEVPQCSLAARHALAPALLLLYLPLIGVGTAASVDGTIVDPMHASIPNATVRLIAQSGGRMAYRATTGLDGHFRIDAVEPGRYTLAAVAIGFQEALRKDLQVREDEKVDAGAVTLEVISCDAPGVNCDYFGGRFPREPLAVGDFHAANGCAIDFDASKPVCGNWDKTAEVAVRQDTDGRTVLAPLNGSTLAEPDSVYDCRRAAYSDAPVPIEGLGPRSDICIRTKRKRYVHLFFTEGPDANGVSFHYVVRK